MCLTILRSAAMLCTEARLLLLTADACMKLAQYTASSSPVHRRPLPSNAMLISKRADACHLERHAAILVECAPTPSLLKSSQR